MTINEMISAIEACLFASGEPVSLGKIAQAVEADEKTVAGAIKMLSDRFVDSGSAIELIQLDDMYQLCTKKQYAPYVKNLLEIKRNTPLSQSALETLAIVAYNQPVTKAYIEQVRGVDCSWAVGTLCDKQLIEPKGRLDAPGKPILYGTTTEFLRVFGMTSLEDLPHSDSPLSVKKEDGEQTTILQENEQNASE